MEIIVDLIIVAIIVISTLLGYKKGLISLAVKLCTFVIAIVATSLLYVPITNLVINTTGIDETIESAIIEKAMDAIDKENSSDYTPEMVSKIKEEAKTGVLKQSSRTLAINIVRAGVMIILFVGIRIALRFVTSLANLIAKIPIIKQINKGGGLLYGLLRGLLIIYVTLIIISIIGKINEKNSVHLAINESVITKSMYNNNLLNVFFK